MRDKELKNKNQRLYYEKNKLILAQKKKIYNELNKEKRNEYKRNYNKLRFNTDILFRLKCNIRSNFYKSFSDKYLSKNTKTIEMLGCSVEQLKEYLESKFESWMTWDNYGLYNGTLGYGWDIDHIIPTSSGTNEEEIVKLNHYTNLQPLCSYTNRNIKRNKFSFYTQ